MASCLAKRLGHLDRKGHLTKVVHRVQMVHPEIVLPVTVRRLVKMVLQVKVRDQRVVAKVDRPVARTDRPKDVAPKVALPEKAAADKREARIRNAWSNTQCTSMPTVTESSTKQN